MSLFLNTLILSFQLPAAKAALRGDNYVTEISLPKSTSYLTAVDVDSEGRIFINLENDVYRSTDGGATWTDVLDMPYSTNTGYVLFVDSNDYIHTSVWNSSIPNWDVWRSTDHGDTWTRTLSDVKSMWHMDKDLSGTSTDGYLYMNNYDNVDKFIWRSTDQGASLSVWANFSDTVAYGDPEPTHVHVVQVDWLGQVWVGSGDGVDNSRIDRWNKTAWEKLTPTPTAGAQPTDFYFDNDYAYAMPDACYELWRFPVQGTWVDREIVLDVRFGLGKSGNPWVFTGENIDHLNELYVFATTQGLVFATWDNIHFVKVFETPSTAKIFRISQRSPIHFVDQTNDKLYRLSITKEDVIHLFYQDFLSRRGSLTSAAIYVLEQRVHNGSQIVDLTDVALTNVQASIIGLRREHSYTPYGNSGWEWGNKTGWTETGSPLGTVVNNATEAYEGSYYYKVVKNTADRQDTGLRNSSTTYPIMFRGDILVMSAYVKGNISVSKGGYFYITKMNPYTKLMQIDFDVTTEWSRVWGYYILGQQHDYDNATMRISISFKDDYNATYSMDAFHAEYLDVGLEFYNGSDQESIGYSELHKLINYFDSTVETQDPTLTIGGQVVSHAGTLSNGSESSVTNLSGTLYGAVTLSASIKGSGQAILKLNGTRILYEDSMILKGRKDNVYYGRYYGTFSPTINTNDLVAVTKLASNIISLSYASNKLTLTIDSPTGTSTTKVCCGMRGEPTAIYMVNGTLTWSYNASTTILTLNVTHASPTRILVYWKFPGDSDSDGDVDVYDLYILAVAYGSHVEDPNYDSDSDIDGNNHVNSDDLYILAEDYGELEP